MGLKTVLITGAPGWMGTRLSKRLVEEGYQVRCLVYPGMQTETLKRLGLETVYADLTRPETLSGVCTGISIVFHCAGLILGKTAEDFFNVNTWATGNLASEAVKAGAEKFIYVSSNCAGLGDSCLDDVDETNPPRPYLAYGKSKLEAEKRLMKIHGQGKLKVVIIRPNWLYGIGGHARQLNFIRMARRGTPIIFGNGNQPHTLCDIQNCIEALILAAKSSRAVGQTYYIGDREPYTLRQVYDEISKILNVPIRPLFIPAPSYSSQGYYVFDRMMQMTRFHFAHIHMAWEWSKRLVCRIQKAESELGYKPAFTFAEGIRKAIEDYNQRGIAL